MLDLVLAQAVNGLVLGFVYVLIAIGLSVIFGLLGIVNFAHGAFFALGAYFAVALQSRFGWPAVILAPIGVGIVGALIEVTLIRRLYGRDPLTVIVLTFALALFIEALIRLAWGTGSYPFAVPPFLRGFFEWGPILITQYRLAVAGVTTGLLALLWLFLVCGPAAATRRWSGSSASTSRSSSRARSASAACSPERRACSRRRSGASRRPWRQAPSCRPSSS